jgi:GH15 family glucan-1,4-alpha-glucosidase
VNKENGRMPANSYQPIPDYAAIGNLRTVALVGLDGSIDWCCFPHLDRSSVFAAVLDARRGGRFRVVPEGMERGEQRYRGNTNILETSFGADSGRLTVTDLMPLRGDIAGLGGSEAPGELHRLLHGEGGDLQVIVEWTPRLDYARGATSIGRVEHGWLAEATASDGSRLRTTLSGLKDAEIVDAGDGPSLRARVHLRGGDRLPLIARWDTTDAGAGLDSAMDWLEDTSSTWENWVRSAHDPAALEWAGSWLPLVTRSELALKLLTHTDTGAIAAAATTSLPETIGGKRNWDYRYCWIRDASLTVQALIAIGHEKEALEFILWAERVSQEHGETWRPQLMYGLHGEAELEEYELDHLEGYRGSRPVRVGNAAALQRQLDTYGELLNSAYELVRRDVRLDERLCQFLSALADRACSAWNEPDHGIWEVRHGENHFTYSKLMVWLALQRAVHLHGRNVLEGDVARWSETRDLLRDQVLRKGYDPEVGAFVQAFGSKDLDASNLLIPFYELLPYDDGRVQGTIDQTLQGLTTNGLVYRYHAEDGLEGEEGAFGLCTFWLVDALALSGRLDEAWEIFEGIARRANHVGLFSEQIDPETGEALGNFPQAFTHIGLINSRLYLAHGEGKQIPGPPLQGTPEHRAELAAAAEPEGPVG